MASAESQTSSAITLPKGGGAMRGIGESFSPDLHTGTGNFSIPIALPPGRSGLQPQLALTYSTGNGNGPFGLGWALGVPGVSRKTARGIPRYSSSSLESDVFVLSGAEDLVPITSRDGMIRYQPRTEGLFAQIEHHSGFDTNHWEVRSKDGLTSRYGTPNSVGSDPACVRDPADLERVFAWRLSETLDPFGHRIRYGYSRRGSEDLGFDQLYLSTIRYAELPGLPHFLISVHFEYEDRPDPFSDHRSGFEVRTDQRCSSIEVWTHADQDRLVRRYRLLYQDQLLLPELLPANGVSLLAQVVLEAEDGDERESLPPLKLEYSVFAPQRRRYQTLWAEADTPPLTQANPDIELIGLFGNGLPDLVQFDGQVRYHHNTGGGFGTSQTMPNAPFGLRLSDPGVQILDANGDGRPDVLALDGLRNGYYPLTFGGEWQAQGLVRLEAVPSVDLGVTDVRLFDLDGDGITDALRTGDRFELFYFDGQGRWDRTQVLTRGPAERFPDVSFTDPRVKLADFTGDGLQDIARVQDGLVEYWPYQGYGRWGRRVQMQHSPRFEDAILFPGTGFDPQRLLVGDVDGDGLADLIYVGANHITVWINQSGNAWSDPITVHGTPITSQQTGLRLADMFGQGTDGVLWSYPAGSFPDGQLKFLDLTGGIKPYLLTEVNGQMGSSTRVSYAPSTRFYLEDQRDPRSRWRTPLPFPVQVVSKVETFDQVSQGKLATTYRYHHGYWDGVEREFRGFGMVEQFDTENFADFHDTEPALMPVTERYFSSPILSKTWFHQGPVDLEPGDWFELDWREEYWTGDPQALEHSEAVNRFLSTLTEPSSKRDALRTLRGSVLRSEVYALDGSDRQDRPFTVTEHAYGLREEAAPTQAEADRQHIFFPHPLAQRVTQWERGDEPMTQFSATDEYDAFGQAQMQAALAVPRGRDYRVADPNAQPYLGTLSRTRYTQPSTTPYMVNRVASTEVLEVINDGRSSIFELLERLRDNMASTKLISQSFNHYDGPAFEGLPFGQLGPFGALVRTETLIATPETLTEAYPDGPPILLEANVPWTPEYPLPFPDGITAQLGYTRTDGSDHRSAGLFVQASRVEYDFQRHPDQPAFGLPLAQRDPLGLDAQLEYDQFSYLLRQTTDPAGLSTQATHDYRVLLPTEVTDANGNRSRATYSPLGFVRELWALGKADEHLGDLTKPSCRFEYDLHAFANTGEPIHVRAIRFEHHDTETDLTESERQQTITTIEYSDGFGRVIQTRVQAEDLIFPEPTVPLEQLNPQDSNAIQGVLREGGEPNVVVTGWQVFDNKGRVVEQYEPFHAVGWDFSPRQDAQRGQHIEMHYDPRGQVIRTLNPDGSEQRLIYGIPTSLAHPDDFTPTPWEAYTYDPNDNAERTHPLEAQAYQHHWNTPASLEIDALGRTIKTTARNRRPGEAIEEIITASSYDIRGNLLSVTDALGRLAFTYVYDLANRPLRTDSIDAGRRTVVLDATGKEIERRDSKRALLLTQYDRLHRPTHLWARDDASSPVTLRQAIQYGDAGDPNQDPDERRAQAQANRLGKPHVHYDEAGRTTVNAYDFKGNPLGKIREVISNAELETVFATPANGYTVDWQAQGQSLELRASSILEAQGYETALTYDALNRIRSLTYPQDEDGERKILRPHYNSAGALERVTLNDRPFVTHIAYNAKGQRTLIARDNDTITRYAYDPRTFRLVRMRSERHTQPDPRTFQPRGGPLQDLAHEYDLVGNILRITDITPGCGVLNTVTPGLEDTILGTRISQGNAIIRSYKYDAINRLTSATGREANNPNPQEPWLDQPPQGFNSGNHGTPNMDNAPQLTRRYTQTYRYDVAGNILQLAHDAPGNSFNRNFTMQPGNNRLQTMTVNANTFAYIYDVNGNMTREAGSRHFDWNHSDQLKAFRVQTGTAEASIHALYLYDAAGIRVKKLVRKQGGQLDSSTYIDDLFEHHRWAGGDNNYLHIMDGQQRVAMQRVGPSHPQDRGPAVQYHLGDHLGSSGVVLDDTGAFINREEFMPYGESSFGGFSRKRYRFTGKERDEESGLNYHEARYYFAWIGKWASTDPLGATSSFNLYTYSTLSPVNLVDPKGLEDQKPKQINLHDTDLDAPYVGGNFDFFYSGGSEATITFKAKLNYKEKFSPQERSDLENNLRKALDSWDKSASVSIFDQNNIKIKNITLRFKLDFVTSGENKEVEVHKSGDESVWFHDIPFFKQEGRESVVSEVNIFISSSSYTLSHEIGHVFGLKDEYDTNWFEMNFSPGHVGNNKQLLADKKALLNEGSEFRDRYFEHFGQELAKYFYNNDSNRIFGINLLKGDIYGNKSSRSTIFSYINDIDKIRAYCILLL